jgi:antitoxin HicB
LKNAGRPPSNSNSLTNLKKAMSKQKISKAEMAKRLKTSRTGFDRLLDPDNTSITLNTMAKVAHLLGKRIDFALR